MTKKYVEIFFLQTEREKKLNCSRAPRRKVSFNFSASDSAKMELLIYVLTKCLRDASFFHFFFFFFFS